MKAGVSTGWLISSFANVWAHITVMYELVQSLVRGSNRAFVHLRPYRSLNIYTGNTVHVICFPVDHQQALHLWIMF